MSEGTPFSPDGFNWLVKRVGQKAGLPFQAHAHMLRHSAGYKLAGDGHDTQTIQDYLGYRNISNPVRYTELSPTRFKGLLAGLDASDDCKHVLGRCIREQHSESCRRAALELALAYNEKLPGPAARPHPTVDSPLSRGLNDIHTDASQ
jgi:hypothetical protein